MKKVYLNNSIRNSFSKTYLVTFEEKHWFNHVLRKFIFVIIWNTKLKNNEILS